MVLTDTPVFSERGTRTEYTTEVEIPANRVYLFTSAMVSQKRDWMSTATHMLTQIVDNSFRRGDQFSGSSGSLEGVGIKTMSLFPLACWADITWSKSSKVTVPGTALLSTIGVIFLTKLVKLMESVYPAPGKCRKKSHGNADEGDAFMLHKRMRYARYLITPIKTPG